MAERTRQRDTIITRNRRENQLRHRENVSGRCGDAPDQMGDRNRRRVWQSWQHDDGIYEDTLSDAGSIRGVDV